MKSNWLTERTKRKKRKRGRFQKFIGRLTRLVKNKKALEDREFSRADIGRIRKAVKEQLKSSLSWLEIDSISFPRPGHIFRIKADARYLITRPGSLIFIESVLIIKEWLENPEQREVGILLLDNEGRLVESTAIASLWVRVKDIEPIENEKELIENWDKPLSSSNSDRFHDGEAVELAEDFQISQQSQQEAGIITFSKSLKGVIDKPKMQRGTTLDELNVLYQREGWGWFETSTVILLADSEADNEDDNEEGHHLLDETPFKIPRSRSEELYQVYFPYYQTYLKLPRSKLRRRSFDKKMFDRVVMSDETRRDILSLVQGKEEVLNQWGINTALQRGTGKIVLAYGPSGTGKTMTGEALAEKLEKPLYLVNSGNFGPSIESFERGLRDVIEKTERWNSVTVINESEIILEARKPGFFESNMRVGAVLRNLEKLQRGILWLTTNRPIVIDFAVESRIMAQFCFPDFDKEKRKKVWKISLPPDMPVPQLNRYLDKLAEIPINGREIGNAITNAANQASKEGLDHVPAAYLLKWAKVIPENKRRLRGTTEEGKEQSALGFKQTF